MKISFIGFMVLSSILLSCGNPQGADQTGGMNSKYIITCQCTNVGNESVTGKSNSSLANAKLTAGSLCSTLPTEIAKALQDGGDIPKPEDILKIDSILQQTISDVESGKVDDSVLDLISNCQSN